MLRFSSLLMILGAGLLPASGTARAAERPARVVPWKPVGGPAACAQRVEALLRQRGYRLVDETYPREKLKLEVVVRPDCRQDRDRRFHCKATLEAGGPGSQGFSMSGAGMSLGSWSMALDEACREATERLADQLGAVEAGLPPASPPGCKAPN